MLIITCTNVIEVLYIIGKANGEALINHLGTDWFDDWFIVFNATFSNISAISWWPVLVVEEAGVPGENHRPWASSWYSLFDDSENRENNS
jgi:hypothetical protein